MDLNADSGISQIISYLAKDDDSPVFAEGNWGSFAPLLASWISNQLKRPVLFISPHIDDADNSADDISVFAGRSCQTLPAWESQPSFADATDEIGTQRLAFSLNIQKHGLSDDAIISTSILALCQPVAQAESIEQSSLLLNKDGTFELELITQWLVDKGFERVDRVDMPGQFAARGGIIDIFSPMCLELSQTTISQAVRIEFFGDQIESIRTINLDSQLSDKDINNISIVPPISYDNIKQNQLFINMLPKDTIIILNEPADIQETAELFLDRIEDITKLYSFNAIIKACNNFKCLYISRFGYGADNIKLNVKSAQQYVHKTSELFDGHRAALGEILEQAQQGRTVLLYCENNAEKQRLTEIITETGNEIPANLLMPIGFIHQGFILPELNSIVISHHEIFGQLSVRRRIKAIRRTTPIDSFFDLNKGDFVVHISYGIGKFLGTKTIMQDQTPTEYLMIEYADKHIIYVSVHNIPLVHKFVGSTPKRPKLSKVGSKLWERQKEKVSQAITDLAEELLLVQAKRKTMGGIAFNLDSTLMKEFEETFPYQETPDQLTSISEIKSDMTKPIPMDRLLCGDVGYGKTELAMRAAFKAVDSGRQVAVLVPTTVLCIQHSNTFAERFADFPITIEFINRFKTAKEARQISEWAKQGKVDILIGTHRLLSSDISFSNLGLVIIDEEQRFGVEHKERLKRLCSNVDILTMTATPIPRTLNMALLGLRDISSLATPPIDRRNISTIVCRFDERTIRKAILTELNRQGQVFFLHNRVQSIAKIANQIQQIVPEAKIDIAHGQMPKHELEDAMIKFVLAKTDVLVCTTIIESGLDIPNANTIFINDADRFGLAQLHQLRGRVGRYKHKAYAYMLMPMTRTISPIAAKRLKAIEEYSELGSGFKIALRDLEIRGAGNILGQQQSGHIQTIGYELYCKLLTEAVKRLKNEPIEIIPSTTIDLGFSFYIPKQYIASDKERMNLYRKIAHSKSLKDVDAISAEIGDMFGNIPEQVGMLMEIAALRILGQKWGIKSIIVREQNVIFSFNDHQKASNLFAKAPGTVRIPDPKTVILSLNKNYFQPQTLLAVLRKMLK